MRNPTPRSLLQGAPHWEINRWGIIFFGLVAGVMCLPQAAEAAVVCRQQSIAAGGSSQEEIRRNALRSIPWDKLSPAARARADSVLSNVSVFRRLPTKVIDCNPDLYLYLVRNPDVVVNLWEVLDVSRLRMSRCEEERFRLTEPGGVAVTVEYLYRSHNLHLVYGEGLYIGPLLARPIRGRGLLVLKTAYVQEPTERYYIASRLDCFLSIEPLGVELAAKTVSPLLGKTADDNFIQTLNFVAALSRTAELNPQRVHSLAAKLERVPPQVRERFIEVAAGVSQKSAFTAHADSPNRR